jgi:Tfp pilus assembly protein PilX
MTNSRTNHNKKRKMNGSPLSGSLSPNSLAPISPAINVTNFGLDKSIQSRKKSQSSSKLINSRTLTADASTCTPSNMFTETAESFAREQASRGQTSGNSIISVLTLIIIVYLKYFVNCNQLGVKRRSNRNSSRPNKRQQTSNSALRLIDQQIPFTTIMPQTESFSVYRNCNLKENYANNCINICFIRCSCSEFSGRF